MKKKIIKKIQSLINYLKTSAPPHRFNTIVLEELEEMVIVFDKSDTDFTHLESLALGIGRFISDDFNYSESETGEKILDVINSTIGYIKSSA